MFNMFPKILSIYFNCFNLNAISLMVDKLWINANYGKQIALPSTFGNKFSQWKEIEEGDCFLLMKFIPCKGKLNWCLVAGLKCRQI